MYHWTRQRWSSISDIDQRQEPFLGITQQRQRLGGWILNHYVDLPAEILDLTDEDINQFLDEEDPENKFNIDTYLASDYDYWNDQIHDSWSTWQGKR